MTTEVQPYLGPRPFEREHRGLFFGRELETRQLKSSIIAHPTVLLFAQSGTGKTSLVNAGLIPLLEDEAVEVLPPVHVGGKPAAGINPDDIRNIYAFNAICSWAEQEKLLPLKLTTLSLADFLKQRDHRLDEDGQPAIRVIIFDQFEQLFTHFPERWKDRSQFFEQLAVAHENDPLLRTLIVIREDYLAELEPFRGIMPTLLQTYFRLERMHEEAALVAITGPLSGTGRSFAPGVAEQLAKELLKIHVETVSGEVAVIPGQYIEPVQLQVVCQSIWDGLPDTAGVITHEHLRTFGDVDQALARFYENSLAQAISAGGIDEWELREWFETGLITPAGTRGTMNQGKEATEGIPNSIVELFQGQHIIRGEWRAGSRWIELTHDRFIEPIRKSNREWLSTRWEGIQTRKRLEACAAVWISEGRRIIGLLDGVELLKAESWLKGLVPSDPRCGEEVYALIAASRQNEDRKQREQELASQRELRQARKLAVILGTICVLVVVVGAVSTHHLKSEGRFTRSRELAGAAFREMGKDPELSVLLALQAVTLTAPDNKVTPQAEAALYRVLHSSPLKFRLTGHTDEIRGLAYSPDGSYLATASADGTARLWDTVSGRELHRLATHKGGLYSASFSPDSNLLATAGGDRIIRVWNPATGRHLRDLSGHSDMVYSIAFGPQGLLVSASLDGEARVWNPADGSLVRTIAPRLGPLFGVAFSPDGRGVAMGARSGQLLVWDIDANRPVFSTDAHTGSIYQIAFSPDGKTLATAGSDRNARVWNAGTGAEIFRLSGHTLPVTGLTYSPDGRRLVTASMDGTARTWDLVSGREIRTFAAHGKGVLAVAFTPDGQTLATAGRDNTAAIWTSHSDQLQLAAPGSDRIYGLAYSPDGRYLATGHWDGTARLWDARREQELFAFTGHTDLVFRVAFSNDGRLLATSSWDGTAKIWDIASGREIRTLGGGRGQFYGVAFSANGLVATSAEDGTATIWDVTTGKAVQILRGHSNEVFGLEFSRDGRYLATASLDGTARVWSATDGVLRHTLSLRPGSAYGVAFSPDGQLLATTHADGSTRIWDIATERERATLFGHSGMVFGASFSPDGKRLATAGADKTARIWDTRTGDELFSLPAQSDRVNGVVFSPDGHHLATAGRDGRVRIYPIAADASGLRQLGYAHVSRTLTRDECRKYLGQDTCPPTVTSLAYVVEGNSRARNNDVAGAVANYRQAIQQDRSLPLAPEREARRVASEYLVARGRQLALAGRSNEATLNFREAKKLDPSLDLEPTKEPGKLLALERQARGRQLARQGRIEEAISLMEAGKRLFPGLPTAPEREARRLAAACLVALGRDEERADRFAKALTSFRAAKEVCPDFPIEPGNEGQRFDALNQILSAQQSARQGRVPEALVAYRQAQERHPTHTIPARHWNVLCWAGALRGYAREVMPACEEAVRLSAGDAPSRDSRGVARALTGNREGAIADFNAFIDQTDDRVQKERRKEWVKALRAGEQPFKKEELERLQYE